MKFELPSPLTEAPPARSFRHDFTLLLGNQLRVAWNKIRHWPRGALFATAAGALLFTSFLVYLAGLSRGLLQQMDPGTAGVFLSMIFLAGFGGVLFFGITAAFATLYMSDDLELLFMAPVSTRAVFAVKSLVVAGGNAVTVLLFVFLPALFFGLFFGAGPLFYPWAVLVGLGLWASGTAVAELLNLLVMRIVPPHRSREAVGVLGGLGGLLIALFFQLPNLIMQSSDRFDLPGWLSGQHELQRVMDYFPWGWGARALAAGASGDHWIALGWTLLLLSLSVLLLAPAFLLVERGFRGGWISLSREQSGGRRRKGHNGKKIGGAELQERSALEPSPAPPQRAPAPPPGGACGLWPKKTCST